MKSSILHIGRDFWRVVFGMLEKHASWLRRILFFLQNCWKHSGECVVGFFLDS